ncbi:low-specificity L-threonine aldolase [Candidatus Hydrogenedentota bacterium]
MRIADFRSDTVTKPSSKMREAMASAEVGDDVFGEDPTVNRLQEMTADLLGKESALYVPSGTMANQLAIRTQTRHGDEIILERSTHSFKYESGGTAALSGVMVNLLDGNHGILDVSQIRDQIKPPTDPHNAPTTMICLENTHNTGGGVVYPLEKIAEISLFARDNGLRIHLDGARLFNASVASGVSPAEYAQHFDTVSFCLSKGLGAPVGSMLAGSSETMTRARRFRKMFGGGMRQAGILAAAGIYALDNNIDRLADDHRRARRLADSVCDTPGLTCDGPVETNMLFFSVDQDRMSTSEFVERLECKGVLMMALGPARVRMVTHLDIDDDDVELAIQGFTDVMGI